MKYEITRAKIRSFAPTFTAFVFALGAIATITQPSSAKTTKFFCGSSNGTPVTVARTSRGDIGSISFWQITPHGSKSE